MKEIRVLIVDDQSNVRRGLALRLQLEPDIVVVGEAGDGGEALTAAATLNPDVLLMDYEMPVMDGIEATKALVERDPDSRVVMLSLHDSSGVRRIAAEAGVYAFVAKHEAGERLLTAIRAAAKRSPAQR